MLLRSRCAPIRPIRRTPDLLHYWPANAYPKLKACRCSSWFVAAALAFAGLLAALSIVPDKAIAACVAKTKAALNAPPSSGTSAPPSPAPYSASATPAPHPRLYTVGQEFFTLDRDATAYYSFQGNRDGTAKAKKELRYDRNLWDTCAQLQIRLPFITRYPTTSNSFSPDANPYSGFGNAELRYSYSLEIGRAHV